MNEREKTEQASRDSSLRNLYSSVWLLKIENGQYTIEKIEIGGRALKEVNIFERLMELLTRISPPKVFDSLTTTKFLNLIKIEQGMDTQSIVDTFFSALDFPKVVNENVIKTVITKCIKDGHLGVTKRDKVQIYEGKPIVPEDQLTFEKEIPPEEIDISSTYLVAPKIMSLKEETVVISPVPTETKKYEISEETKITQVKYYLKNVNRMQLYKCFTAIGNLAEKCGFISITIEAQSDKGIDKNWLKNTVEEPIEESDITMEKEEE